MNIEDYNNFNNCPFCNSKFDHYRNVKAFDKICNGCGKFYVGTDSVRNLITYLRYDVKNIQYIMFETSFGFATFLNDDAKNILKVNDMILPESFKIEDLKLIMDRLLDLSIYS